LIDHLASEELKICQFSGDQWERGAAGRGPAQPRVVSTAHAGTASCLPRSARPCARPAGRSASSSSD